MGSQRKTKIWVLEQGKMRSHSDQLAVEEPLEIRLASPQRTVAITMRTPGHDFELAAGFLYAEGVVQARQDIQRLSYCINPKIEGEQRYNIVNVELQSSLVPDLQSLERHFYTTSACGICGKASLEQLKIQNQPITSSLTVTPALLQSLPEKLRSAQKVFSKTGGLHAAGLFNETGDLILLREDIGRHNALDKIIGAAFLNGELPLNHSIIMVSGRASFELLQKCLAAGVSVFCAVSAPSSLAVDLAREFGITLVGFLRGEKFNVYSGIERINPQSLPES